MKKGIFFIVALFAGLIAASSAIIISYEGNATETSSFYKDKTIYFVVGFPPGGGYDTYTRIIARHIGKHIPGNPIIIVQNKPGAGSMIVANYLYNRVKPDGLTFGVWNGAFILSQALGDKNVRFDGRKFGWVGAPVNGTPACGIMGFTGLRTLDDVLNSKKILKFGATRVGSGSQAVPEILNSALGTNLKVILGYKGTSDIRLAMQRREVDGACFTWESMRTTARAMFEAEGGDKFIPFIIHRRVDDPEGRNLPLIPDTLENKADRKILDLYNAWAGQYEFQRPLVAPPGVPLERLRTMRRAYEATMKDPDFWADATTSALLIQYISAEKIYQCVDRILSISPKVQNDLKLLVSKRK